MVGGVIDHLTSSDGVNFYMADVAMRSKKDTFHAGIYDPQPAIINNKKYITYSAFNRKSHANIYLLESISNSWNGPWKHRGLIFSHNDILLQHNHHKSKNYEWGLEGSQLIQLPDNRIVLIGVCFLPSGEFGTRQRLFLATSNKIEGPYYLLCQASVNSTDENITENGHGGMVLINGVLNILFQGRSNLTKQPWRYYFAKVDIKEIGKINKFWFNIRKFIHTYYDRKNS